MQFCYVQRLDKALRNKNVIALSVIVDLSDEARRSNLAAGDDHIDETRFYTLPGRARYDSLLQGLQVCLPSIELLGLKHFGLLQQQVATLANLLRQIKHLRSFILCQDSI